jgi:glycosyltransferase involved in cell wall biosynthesis
MMNILIITPFPLLPLSHGGRARTYGLATALARAGANVHVLFPWIPGLPRADFQRAGVHCHPHTWLANVSPAILGDRLVPPIVSLSCQPLGLGPRQRLRRLGQFDVVQFEFCAYPRWMEALRGSAKIVYSSHNVERDLAAAQKWPWLVGGAAMRRLARLESLSIRAADLVLVCNQADRERQAELYGKANQTEVIRHGFDEAQMGIAGNQERWQARLSFGFAPGDVVLLFVGGRAHHNREAARFLERDLMPRLGAAARLLLVGECCRERERSNSRVRRLGYIEDLRPVYAAADIAVNPVTYGSGASMKVMEYLAVGLPVVSTAAGMRGYEHLRDRIHTAGLANFADAIRAVQRTPRVPVPELHELTWNALGLRLHQVYARLCEEIPS